ncbi:MAG TPA: thioredoxin [Candidatus Hydrogenedentes bacterium]|nr:thioredoxin [Candidatus Hydrogenedentota bacterium]HIJ73159.1 thioredoxin [Candidatus Hydrogenedentota bacterium]
MSNARDLTAADFDEAVASGVTLVDFWAEWCGPCRMMAPALDEIADEYDGKAVVAKVNVDSEGDLAQRFGVSSIPTLIVFNGGEEAKRFVGVTPKGDLTAALAEVCG